MQRNAHLSSWRRYVRFWRPDVDADVDDEVRFHLESRVDELIALGRPPYAARAQAVAEFGDVAAVRNGLRTIDRRILERQSRAEWWRTMGQELRVALRRLARHPGFSVPAIITLALGIGASVAVFTLLYAVVLTPLPYRDADRLVRLWSAVPGIDAARPWAFGKGQFLYYRAHASSFESLGLYVVSGATVASSGTADRQAERTRVALVSASVADVLHTRMLFGRPLTTEDNLQETPAVALLAHDFWARRFGMDSSVVGRTITVDGRTVQVVGVLAAGAELPEEVEARGANINLWMPLWLDPAEPPANHHVFRAIGRLRPNVTAAAARADLARLTARFPDVMPGAYQPRFMRKTGFAAQVVPLSDDVLGGIRRVLWILFGSVVLVLVIASANVANLFLVRIEARRRETAIRAALGASRAHLARFYLAETMPLTFVAGALAVALAYAAIRLLLAASPSGIPRLAEVGLGWPGITFAALAALGTGVIFGMMPLARRGADVAVLAEAGRGATASRGERGARSVLVIAQVALSLVLLAGAALLIQSFRHLRSVRPGLDPTGVLTFGIALPATRYDSLGRIEAFDRELTARIEALPGVEVAGLTTSMPLTDVEGCSGIDVENPALAPGDRPSCVPVVLVTPGYFRALAIPVRGRAPDWGDFARRAPVAVVAEALARRLWPAGNALNRGIRTSCGADFSRVVGVAGDVRADGLDKPPIDAVYITMYPAACTLNSVGMPLQATMVVRTRMADPGALTPAIRRTLAAIDPQVAISDVRLMNEIVAASMARVSFTTLLLGLASGIALLLSAVGIYGVVSYLVAQRRSEIGIRMALGAGAGQVGRLVVLQSVRLAAVGVAIGLATALLATRLLRSLLFEVSPTDLVTLGAVSVFLVLLAAAASYAPARRAMSVDPAESLRHE